MKFFSAAPISTPTFRPAQFPAPQRQSAATDTGTQPTPQGSPVVTGFKPETRSKNVQLASPSAVAPDPQVVPAAQTPQVFQGPSAVAPVMPAELDPIPHPSTQQPFQPGMHGPAPMDPNHPAMAAWQRVKDSALQKWRETGQWIQPPSYQAWYDQNSWNFLNPLPIPREGGLIETPAPVTTTTVAPQQGMVVPVSGATMNQMPYQREASHTGANPRATPAAQAAKYTAARNRSGIYTGLAR